jgi:hypothetical protein
VTNIRDPAGVRQRDPGGVAAGSFSSELQRCLVQAAVPNPSLESVPTMPELTGVAVSKRSLEEILPDAAQDLGVHTPQRLWKACSLRPPASGRCPNAPAPTSLGPSAQRRWESDGVQPPERG